MLTWRVRAFAYAEGLLAKTIRIDGACWRRYGEKIAPRTGRCPHDAARGHIA